MDAGNRGHGGLGVVAFLLLFTAFVLVTMLVPHALEATALFIGNEREIPLAGLNAAVLFGAVLAVGGVVVGVVAWLGES